MRFNFFYANPAGRKKLQRTVIGKACHFRRFQGLGVLLWALLLVSCKEPTHLNSSSNPPADFVLPMKLRVEDSQGRALEIQLLARTEDSMTFLRLSDNIEFTIPLSQISSEDRALIQKFPKTDVQAPQDRSIAGQYIATRRKLIERYTQDIEEIRLELVNGDLPAATVKAKLRDLERKRAEVKKMQDQIAEKQSSR